MNRQRGVIPITLIFYAVAALAVMGAIYGVYKWIDTSWETSAGIKRGAKDKQAEWDKAVADQREAERVAAEQASSKLETNNAKSRVVYKTITQAVDRYIDRPVYRNDCWEPAGLLDANRALLGGESGPPGKPDRGLPAVDAASGRDGRLDTPKGR